MAKTQKILINLKQNSSVHVFDDRIIYVCVGKPVETFTIPEGASVTITKTSIEIWTTQE